MKTIEKQINENLSVHFYGELENVPEYIGDVEKTISYVVNVQWDKSIHTPAENELIVQWLKKRYNYESTIQLLTVLMLEDEQD
jgi:hypothetical protein